MSKIWIAITSAEMLIVCQLSARNWQRQFFFDMMLNEMYSEVWR